MGLWQRATLVLRASATLRKQRAAQADAGDVVVSGEQLQALQDIADRMAGMAVTIKQLEEKAKDLEAEAEAEAGAQAGDAASSEDAVAVRAQVQIDVIDEMLDGIRALRVAIDQQRTELTQAEQEIQEGGETRAGDNPSAGGETQHR
jgi:hypothetical protein